MKTTEIMKIEYTEPLMKVKEMRRRRCVVANSAENYGYFGSYNNDNFTETDNED